MQVSKTPPVIVRDLRGEIIAPYDLPPPDTVRWTPNKKAIVVRWVRAGNMPLQEMLDRYHMTEKEFLIWEDGLKDDGAVGLKTTHYQSRRRAKKEPPPEG